LTTDDQRLKQLIDEMVTTIKVSGLTFMYLARPAYERYGKDGEDAVRAGLRVYGKVRGKMMREWHEGMGLPINMETLMRYWDASSTYIIADEMNSGIWTPYYVEHNVSFCPAHDMWKSEGWERAAYIYCDEIHQEVAMNYHPDAVVEIHQNLNKGDPHCGFKWIMRPQPGEVDKAAYEKIDRSAKERPVEYALDSLKRTTRIVALMHCSLAEQFLERFKDEMMVRSSLRELGKKRGEMVAEKLKKSGKPITVSSIFDSFDLAYRSIWKMDSKESNGQYSATVEYCPLAELWAKVGKEKLGAIYCEETYSAMFETIAEKTGVAIDVKIPQTLTRGNGKCVFNISLRKT